MAQFADKDIARFNTKYIHNDSGCWIWQDRLDKRNGYGTFYATRRFTSSHRASWIIHKGPIPNGLHVLHRCDTPACVNADHMFLGTQVDNNKDRASKGRNSKQDGAHSKVARLTEMQVRAIVRSKKTLAELSNEYGVAPGHVSHIRMGITWREVVASERAAMENE